MRYPEEVKQQARELYAQGLSLREVGRRLGVSHHAIRLWLDFEAAKRKREKDRSRYRVNPEPARENARQWAKANPERKRENHKQWRKNNPEYYYTNREKLREKSRRWYQKHAESRQEYARHYRQKNLERLRERDRLWHKENPEQSRERAAFSRAAKRRATPPWLTPEHRKQMRALHAEARRLKKATGIPHHVDHIIPLQAKFNLRGKQIACGLHVPWNLQVMPGPENCAKNCKLPGPEHWTAPAPSGIIEGSSGDTHGFA